MIEKKDEMIKEIIELIISSRKKVFSVSNLFNMRKFFSYLFKISDSVWKIKLVIIVNF